MKKLFCLILIVATIFTLCACSSNGYTSNDKSTNNICGHTNISENSNGDVFDSGIFSAGYYTDDTLTENSLNFDRLSDRKLKRLLIYKFDTLDEFIEFKTKYEEHLNFDSLSYVDNDYFKENTLVLAYHIINNSTYRYKVTKIYIEEEKICVHIRETTNAEIVDNAKDGWFIAVTIDKTITQNISMYDAVLEE